ncbi:hypothetical protein P154DRAFT_525775 [Amniculicola lignicola CBS 123094]|uniref:Uncharacterized protein n=1 Tax=Amniculicola lignicola CBS 123094 TaxID=1392246 RepID=A0A6A5WAQ4_9PLEO|nr:hypothetical protein P154DRAFT_525775 [Amniculicola lignicola CBS 123094]
MAALFKALTNCFTGPNYSYTHLSSSPNEKITPYTDEDKPRTAEDVASQLVHAIMTAQTHHSLHESLSSTVSTSGWKDKFAEKVAQVTLQMLQKALKEADKLAPVVKDAYEKACNAAAQMEGLAKEHPVYATVVAVGVLVVVAPAVLEVLGFGELGPTAGSFAARWMSLYEGEVPAGSLFSFFQRLGMVWRRGIKG